MPKEKLFVINDSTPEGKLILPGKGRGLEMPPRGANPYAGVAERFPDDLLIPESEWADRAREQEERGTRICDLIDYYKIKVKNQQQTNYCWINAPVYTLEVIRAVQNQPYVELSPASAGARITNFKNVGGWGLTALQWLSTEGVAPTSMWPNNSWNGRQYDTAAARAQAKRYVVQEWWHLPVRSLKHQVSCLLRGWPIAGGFNWWAHEVSLIGVKYIDGEVAFMIANSWGPTWGVNGIGYLQGQRGLADDAVAPCTAWAA